MKRIAILALLLPGLATPASAARPADFLGQWENTDAATRGVTRLTLAGTGTILKLQAFGKCHPKDCDWGVADARAHSETVGTSPGTDTEAMTAAYDQGFKKTWIIMRLRGDILRAEIFSRYTDSRPATVQTESFRRSGRRPAARRPGKVVARRPAGRRRPAKKAAEDCIAFNPKRVMAKEVGGRWKVMHGSMMMLDFAKSSKDARRAALLIRHHGLEKQCFVGRPNPSMQYFLTGGAIPSGSGPGEDCVSFNSSTAEVKRIKGSWKIVDGNHWIFDFGNNAAEAREAFSVLRRHGATKSCFVGRPNPPMSYLRK